MAYKKRKYNKGVPTGYRHDWTYRGHWQETKVKPKLWRFKFRATKGRKASRMGGFGIGTTGSWNIKGKQYIRKTGVGQYQTTFIGTKTPNKFKVRKPKKRRKYNGRYNYRRYR